MLWFFPFIILYFEIMCNVDICSWILVKNLWSVSYCTSTLRRKLFLLLHHSSCLFYLSPLGGMETVFRKQVYFTFHISSKFFFSFYILVQEFYTGTCFFSHPSSCFHTVYIINAIKGHSRTLSSKWHCFSLSIRRLLCNTISHIFPMPYFQPNV